MSNKVYRYFCLAILCLLVGINFPKTGFAEGKVEYHKTQSGILFYDSQGLVYTLEYSDYINSEYFPYDYDVYHYSDNYYDNYNFKHNNPYGIKKGELRVCTQYEWSDEYLESLGIPKVALKENIVIPDKVGGYKVAAIAARRFENCSKIKSVEFGKNIRIVEEEAFKNCTNLTKVTFRGSIEQCGTDTFLGTPLCKKAREQGKPLILGKALVDGKGVQGNIIIKGSKVQVIAPEAFYKNKKIRKVKISGVKRIQGQSDSLSHKGAFDSSAVTDLTITGAQIIGKEAFLDCKKLKKARVSGIKTVPVGMFHGCKKMTSVTFGKEVQRFKKESLWHCWNLKIIRIHSKKKIVFEKSSERGYFFPPYPFLGCDKLRHIYMRSNKLSKTFKKTLELGDPTEKKITLHVPKSKKKLYREYTKGKVVTWKKA